MIEASQRFRDAVRAGVPVALKARLSLASGEEHVLSGDDIAMGGASAFAATSSATSFDVGAAVIGTLDLVLANYGRRWDGTRFGGASLELYVGMPFEDGDEWVLRGTYVVEQPDSYGATVGLRCYDRLCLLERAYSEAGQSFPATVGEVVRGACAACGLAAPEGWDCALEVAEAPDADATCLEVVSWAAQASGRFARADPSGRLSMGWYGSGEPARLEAVRSLTVGTDDVEVTGLSVTDYEGGHALHGEDGYVLKVADNPLVAAGRAPDVAALAGPSVTGMSFRPFTASVVADPLVEPGDPVVVVDALGRGHASWATQVSWSASGTTRLSCAAERDSRVELRKRDSAPSAKVRRAVRRAVKAELPKAVEAALAEYDPAPRAPLVTGVDGNEYLIGVDGQGQLQPERIPSAITVSVAPAKTVYYEGLALDYAGLEVTLLCGDGSVFEDAAHPGGAVPMPELELPWETAHVDESVPAVVSPSGAIPYLEVETRFMDGSVEVAQAIVGTSEDGGTLIYTRPDEAVVRVCLLRLVGFQTRLFVAASRVPFPPNTTSVSASYVPKDKTVRPGWSGGAPSSYELDGRTVYYSRHEIRDYTLIGNPVFSIYPTADPEDDWNKFAEETVELMQIVIWHMVYGDDAGWRQGTAHVPVRWTRPQDGKVLEAAFDIEVKLLVDYIMDHVKEEGGGE